MNIKISITLTLFIIVTFFSCNTNDNSSSNKENKKESKVEQPAKEGNKKYTISGNTILDIKAGMEISKLKTKVIKTVSGYPYLNDSTVYKILSQKEEELGFLVPDENSPSLVGDIHITSENVMTEDKINPGMTYDQILTNLKDFKKYGKDSGKRIDFVKQQIVYRIDAPQEQVEENSINSVKQAKVTRIIIEAPIVESGL